MAWPRRKNRSLGPMVVFFSKKNCLLGGRRGGELKDPLKHKTDQYLRGESDGSSSFILK